MEEERAKESEKKGRREEDWIAGGREARGRKRCEEDSERKEHTGRWDGATEGSAHRACRRVWVS